MASDATIHQISEKVWSDWGGGTEEGDVQVFKIPIPNTTASSMIAWKNQHGQGVWVQRRRGEGSSRGHTISICHSAIHHMPL